MVVSVEKICSISNVLAEEDTEQCYKLDIPVYKHMDTSLLDCDVQPNYVRITLKGKVFQLVLWREVNCDASTAQRSQITGHLLVTMPYTNPILKKKTKNEVARVKKKDSEFSESKGEGDSSANGESKNEYLEVDASKSKTVNLDVMSEKGSLRTKNAPYRPNWGVAAEKIASGNEKKVTDLQDVPDDLPPLDEFEF